MKTTKITDGDINDKKIASLPTRPTAPRAFGGRGYTASELKAAFDLLPLFLVDKFNTLISDISGEDGESIADVLPTGIKDSHTLGELFRDIKSGEFITYLAAPSGTVSEYLLKLRADIDKLSRQLGITL
jgi:hypothetical protein